MAKLVENARNIQDKLKIKDIQNKLPKNLFPNETKIIEEFYSDHDFLQNFINDFQDKKDLSSSFNQKYRSLLGIITKKIEKIELKFEDIIEKIIDSEQEFKNNKVYLDVIEKNDQSVYLT